LISAEIIRRYGLTLGMVGEYDEVVIGDIGLLCERSGCDAKDVQILVPGEHSRSVSRYADYAVRHMDSDVCQWVHEQEWERIRRFDANLKSAQPLDLQQAIAEIAKPMPEIQQQQELLP
jgi:hypothetical protein